MFVVSGSRGKADRAPPQPLFRSPVYNFAPPVICHCVPNCCPKRPNNRFGRAGKRQGQVRRFRLRVRHHGAGPGVPLSANPRLDRSCGCAREPFRVHPRACRRGAGPPLASEPLGFYVVALRSVRAKWHLHLRSNDASLSRFAVSRQAAGNAPENLSTNARTRR
jgi:hypothetical protein